MVTDLRYGRLWLVLGWIAVAAALCLSLMPSRMLEGDTLNDKFEHSAGFALLTLWFCGIYPRSRYWAIALSLLGMGIVIEILQGAMHWGRHEDIRDVWADAGGIVVGVVLSLTLLGNWAQRIEALVRRG